MPRGRQRGRSRRRPRGRSRTTRIPRRRPRSRSRLRSRSRGGGKQVKKMTDKKISLKPPIKKTRETKVMLPPAARPPTRPRFGTPVKKRSTKYQRPPDKSGVNLPGRDTDDMPDSP
jgi:hypothetical protein